MQIEYSTLNIGMFLVVVFWCSRYSLD